MKQKAIFAIFIFSVLFLAYRLINIGPPALIDRDLVYETLGSEIGNLAGEYFEPGEILILRQDDTDGQTENDVTYQWVSKTLLRTGFTIAGEVVQEARPLPQSTPDGFSEHIAPISLEGILAHLESSPDTKGIVFLIDFDAAQIGQLQRIKDSLPPMIGASHVDGEIPRLMKNGIVKAAFLPRMSPFTGDKNDLFNASYELVTSENINTLFPDN